MKTLLLVLALLSIAKTKLPANQVAQSTGILSSWSYPAPKYEDVALEMAGTLQLNKNKPEHFRLTVSRAYFENAGITLEGRATYAGDCEMQVRFKSRPLFPLIGYQAQPLNLFSWSESPVRCSRKKAVLWYADIHSTSSGSSLDINSFSQFPFGNFKMLWVVRNLLAAPSSAKIYSSVSLTLRETTHSYIRVYLPPSPPTP